MNAPATHAPALDYLEAQAERVAAELARLLERARAEAAAIQDLDAELDGHGAPGGAFATRERHRYRLRSIARQVDRAQAVLVHPDDERAQAARSMLGWLADADRSDSPWTAAASGAA